MTQWRYSFAGRMGLDYSAVYPVMERLDLAPADWLALLSDLQLMEAQALDIFRRKTK